jgi:UDPglucose--hexose-1-phosphate uridylyltransferase
MPELRWNPLLNTWTMVAGNRQHRPHLPEGNCPFCTGSGKVPDKYEMLVYLNDFPVLSQSPDEPDNCVSDFFKKKPAYGKCEVILYSDDHQKHLFQFSLNQIEKLVRTWKDRTVLLSEDRSIKYVFPFENRGEEVGVTIHHPHGQLYAYSWLPAKIETELNNCKNYYNQYRQNLFDKLIAAEKKTNTRVIFENKGFLMFIPYFSDYPFGVFIVAKKRILSLKEFSDNDISDLAECIKNITGAFETLYDRMFPYMMCVHQAPVNVDDWTDIENYYRFHIEFYPPLRSADKIKWLASSETGAWAAANPRNVDETANELRNALIRFLDNN